jgi:very-short-patch-repair endonuclease
METRLRLELVAARLPTPAVQEDLYDRAGKFLGRVDLFYPDVRLVIEFDGQGHRDRLVPDLRRQNALVNAGYHVLRFTAPDLLRSGVVGSAVRQARERLRRSDG